MNLDIESEEVHRLATHLAPLSGESVTQAITEAIRERIVRMQKANAMAEELLAIGRDCASRLQEPYRSADHGDLLYDKLGVP